GRTWRRQAVFEDDEPGAVEAFWFNSRDSGSLVIDSGVPPDRHHLYETMTGGADWMLRQKSSTAISLKGARAREAASNARIHAVRGSSSYSIEKRPGDEWQPVAEFLIEAGVCR